MGRSVQAESVLPFDHACICTLRLHDKINIIKFTVVWQILCDCKFSLQLCVHMCVQCEVNLIWMCIVLKYIMTKWT